MPSWDAEQYLKFGEERTRAVRDLLARVQLAAPARIVDLGCGPGNSTAELRRRWPASQIVGIDSSPEMLERARSTWPEGNWRQADVRRWQADPPVELVFANALLQWVGDHERLYPHLLGQVAPGGALAVQVPQHYESPVHRELQEISRDPAWNARMEAARASLTHHEPEFYFELVSPLTSRLDLWETTYYHPLPGPAAIVEWFRGSGLRPYLEALDTDAERRRFEDRLLERLGPAYSRRRDGGILFPFRRLFLVAYR